jgi:drug/metabolite transporter (DMT)-like permease
MTEEQHDIEAGLARKARPTLVIGLVALLCLFLTFLNLYLGLQSGGVAPEVALFGILTVVFGAFWWSARRKT